MCPSHFHAVYFCFKQPAFLKLSVFQKLTDSRLENAQRNRAVIKAVGFDVKEVVTSRCFLMLSSTPELVVKRPPLLGTTDAETNLPSAKNFKDVRIKLCLLRLLPKNQLF